MGTLSGSLRVWLERRVEGPPPDGAVWRLLERGWAGAARPARPLVLPRGTRVVCVGGATLGGSGKTPLAVACAAALAARGARVALVGHAHRASPARAQVVHPAGDVRVHGDEALECAQRLAGTSAVVVVGPTRQSAVDLAATLAPTLVLDGPLQLAPRRATLSLLAVPASAPWGSGACPPRGDLRATPAALLAACDAVVAIGPGDAMTTLDGTPLFHASVRSDGARVGDELVSFGRLAALRVGLLTAIARPERVLAGLAARGVRPVVHVRGPDHGPLPRPAPHGGVDLWLATHKCSLHSAAPVAVIDYHLDLPDALIGRLAWARGDELGSR